MTPVSIFNALVLIALWWVQLFRPPFLIRLLPRTVLAALLIHLAYMSYLTVGQYFLWLSGSTLTQYLLPPHTPINYFLFYSYTQFWLYPLMALAMGSLVWFLMRWYNRRHGNQFFYDAEPMLALFCIFLVGHPYWLFYLILILLALLIATISQRLIQRADKKIPFYFLWIPLALVLLLLEPWLSLLSV